MRFRKSELCKELDQYEKIIIYGTGNFAMEIYPLLVERGLKDKIVSFTQTHESVSVSIDGIPVISVEKLTYEKAECVVLVAVSQPYVNEIKKIISDCSYPNIVYLVDYLVNFGCLEEAYLHLETFEEYCEYIADWYLKTHADCQDSFTYIQKLTKRDKYHRNKINRKQIVIICGFLSARIIKIVKALKKQHFEIIMLEYFGRVNPWCLKALHQLDVQIYCCECVEAMLYYALLYHPLVYLIEPRWGDCQWAEIMLKNKQYFGKIILTLYDVMNDGYCKIGQDKLVTEKYALENADGIIWRWFSKEYLEQKGFQYNGQSIQFLDYCNYDNVNLMPNKFNDSEIKLCMVVSYGDEYFEERPYIPQYTDYAKLSEILECIGNRKECIFHFYVGALAQENIIRCEEYEKKYRNFKFFLGTEYDDLVNELANYDYACDLYIGGDDPEDDTPLGDYSGSGYRNSVSNAHFDCLSVGLPIITTRAVKMWEYLSERDIVIKMDLSNFDLEYLKQQRTYYKAEVQAARQELDINNQILRLIEFFEEV